MLSAVGQIEGTELLLQRLAKTKSVPDLMCIVAADGAEPIGTELLRYGYRVAVLGLPAHPLLRTPEALAVVGPRAFGYDGDYVPLAK